MGVDHNIWLHECPVDDRQEARILKCELHAEVPMGKSIGVLEYRYFVSYLSDIRRGRNRGCSAGSRLLLLLGSLLHVLHVALAASLVAHFHKDLMLKDMYIKSRYV